MELQRVGHNWTTLASLHFLFQPLWWCSLPRPLCLGGWKHHVAACSVFTTSATAPPFLLALPVPSWCSCVPWYSHCPCWALLVVHVTDAQNLEEPELPPGEMLGFHARGVFSTTLFLLFTYRLPLPSDMLVGITTPSVCMHAKLLQLCSTLCNPVDCSLLGFSVHGVIQARILEWVAMPSSKGSSQPRNQAFISYVSCISRHVLYH